MNIRVSSKSFVEPQNDVVERKGVGHPDTLADALAETLSAQYSKYTLKNFGAILHHNFDKVGLLGGSSHVTLGRGYLTRPIRVLLNGRASTKFSSTRIPVEKLLVDWTRAFFRDRFPTIDTRKHLEFHLNLSNQSSPGKTSEREAERGTRKWWFEPRSLDDLQELRHLVANDTSLGVGYAPFSNLEKLVLAVEGTLTGNPYRRKNKWIGTDVKVMAVRHRGAYSMTICVPQIANYVHTIEDYRENIEKARAVIIKTAKKVGVSRLNLSINTRDNYETRELYLTAIGSSIESGDEGLVGRGNRITGTIAPLRPMSMEGSCGKNPVYHIGKIYYVAANEIANAIYRKFGAPNEVLLVSQSGRDLLDPWFVIVNVPPGFRQRDALAKFIEGRIKRIPSLTAQFLRGTHRLY